MKPCRKPRQIFSLLAITTLVGSLLLTAIAFNVQASSEAIGECIELVQNGSFESGSAGWQEYSIQGYPLISDFNPRTGRFSAYLGGVNDADDRVSQQLTLPHDATSITLRAWWYLATAETAGAFDTLTVWLLRPDNMPLAQLVQVDNTYPVGIWDELAIDLTSYAGQTVIVQFAGRTDESNISDFYIDDVSVSACMAAATPTATASPTPTATRTPDPNRMRTFLPLIVRG